MQRESAGSLGCLPETQPASFSYLILPSRPVPPISCKLDRPRRFGEGILLSFSSSSLLRRIGKGREETSL